MSFFHLLKGIVGNSFHASLIFLNGISFFYKVYIVKTEVLDAQLFHDFEAGIHFVFGPLYSIVGFVPLVSTGAASKLVTTGIAKGVPPGHSKF